MTDGSTKPCALIVMGVSGSGKSTIGEALGKFYGLPFLDGDSYHPPENVAKMKTGTPLNDADRKPWLERLNREITERETTGKGAVLACSALKATYRDILLKDLQKPGQRGPFTVCLNGTKDVIGERMKSRKGHFMPPSLLESQLATLEPPQASDTVFVIDVGPTPEQIIESVTKRIGA